MLELALRHSGERRLGGAIAVAASLLPETLDDAARWTAPLAPPHTPVLLTRGDADDVIPLRDATRTAEAMLRVASGCGAQLVGVRGKAHGMPRDEAEMRHLMTFWAHTLRTRPPVAPGETLVELGQ